LRAINATPAGWLGNRLGLALLAEMAFESGTLYATSAPIDIDWNGNTYLGGRQVGVEEVKDQGGEVQGLRFSLSGVPSEMVALALNESLQGRSVVLRVALLDPDTQAIGQVLQLWSGTMDQMPVRHGPESSTITVTAEHRGIYFARPKPLRYTDADQRRLYPGDSALEYIVRQSQHQDIWPSAEYFKQ
jgi:hypothetical protein